MSIVIMIKRYIRIFARKYLNTAQNLSSRVHDEIDEKKRE